jgi:hypothetical protein
MAIVITAASPLLGNPAGDRMSTPQPMHADDLARRRTNARRLGWVLGAIVIAVYVAGLFVKR